MVLASPYDRLLQLRPNHNMEFPTEIWTTILGQLSHTDRRSVSLTNHYLRRQVAPTLFARIIIKVASPAEPNATSPTAWAIMHESILLENIIELRVVAEGSPERLKHIRNAFRTFSPHLHKLNRLQNLQLGQVPLNRSSVRSIIACHDLRLLQMDYCTFDDTLEIEDDPSITSDTSESLAHLIVSMQNDQIQTFNDYLFSHFPFVRTFEVWNYNVYGSTAPSELVQFQPFPALEELSIHSDSATDHFQDVLWLADNLHTFTYDGRSITLPSETDAGESNNDAQAQILLLGKLRHLNASMPVLQDLIYRGTPRLQSIHVQTRSSYSDNNHQPTMILLSAIAKSCSATLQRLDLMLSWEWSIPAFLDSIHLVAPFLRSLFIKIDKLSVKPRQMLFGNEVVTSRNIMPKLQLLQIAAPRRYFEPKFPEDWVTSVLEPRFNEPTLQNLEVYLFRLSPIDVNEGLIHKLRWERPGHWAKSL